MMLIWILCIATIVTLGGHCSKDTITWPKDTEAIVGSDVVLNCTSPSVPPLEWHHLPIGSQTAEISHKDGSCLNGYCGRYSMVSNTPGEYSLRIRNVSVDDAGTHRCVLTNEQRGAALNVITIYPSKETCSAQFPTDGVIGQNDCLVDPDPITLSCRLRYVGDMITYLEWIQTTSDDRDFEIANTSINGATTSTLTLKDAQFEEATFLCRIRNTNFSSTSSFNCSYHIKAIPLRLRKATAESTLHQIDCATDLPYKCSYSWRHEDQEVTLSQQLNLTRRQYGKYTCRATCDVRGRSCTFLSVEVTYRHADNSNSSTLGESKSTLIVGPVVAVFLFMGIVAVILVLLKRRRKACHSKTRAVIKDSQEDRKGNRPADESDKSPTEDQNKGEEIEKLLETNVDEEPKAYVLSFDDQTEGDMPNLTSASTICNIKMKTLKKPLLN